MSEANATRIRSAAENLVRAKEEMQQVVNEARGKGDSWATIGGYLGISRQAAWERFREDSDAT